MSQLRVVSDKEAINAIYGTMAILRLVSGGVFWLLTWEMKGVG